MKVAIFKSEGGNFSKYSTVLTKNDIEAVLIPSIDFSYKNLDKFKDKLNDVELFSGLIFTSPRSVLATKEALNDNPLNEKWKNKLNFSVGETTWTECRNQLSLETKGKETGNAQKLSELIIQEVKGEKDLLPFLFPCSNLKQDTLQKNLENAGLCVSPLEIYETVQHPKLKKNLVQVLDDSEIEYLVFFSPSGVNFSQEIAIQESKDLSSKKLVAIGPSTKRAIEAHELTVFATADFPSPEALLAALGYIKRKHDFVEDQGKKS